MNAPTGELTLSLPVPDDHALTVAERTDLTQSVQHTIARYRDQPDQINLLTLEAVSLSTAVAARAHEAKQQGCLTRGMKTLTGKNWGISTQNQADLARCAYIAQETLNHLYAQNLITFEALSAVDRKANRLARDLAEARQDVNNIYTALNVFFQKVRERFEHLEHPVKLLRLDRLVKSSKPVWHGLSYAELELFQKLICLTNDFFFESECQ